MSHARDTACDFALRPSSIRDLNANESGAFDNGDNWDDCRGEVAATVARLLADGTRTANAMRARSRRVAHVRTRAAHNHPQCELSSSDLDAVHGAGKASNLHSRSRDQLLE